MRIGNLTIDRWNGIWRGCWIHGGYVRYGYHGRSLWRVIVKLWRAR